MIITAFALLLGTFAITADASSNHFNYTVETFTVTGVPCLTDCDDNDKCWISYNKQEQCTKGYKKAPTYYTSRFRYYHKPRCLSKCDFAGYSYSWCYVDKNGDWDYCNPTESFGKWYQYTKNYGRCSNECVQGHLYTWCETFWRGNHWWDKCDIDGYYYYEEDTNTVYGKKCLTQCVQQKHTYFWCIDDTESQEKCAPAAVRYVCPAQRKRRSVLSRQPRSSPPRKTVADYNQDIDNDNTLTTITMSTSVYPDQNNPILDYTYRDLGNGVLLPYRIRARICPSPFNHINTKKRKSSDISSGARNNCNRMGLNRCLANNNNDQCGHLVPYILGGPADWFNIVPQTQRINIGTTTNSDLNAPSIWAITERLMRRWVEDGGSVQFEVLVAYDLPLTRPTGFGVIEQYYRANGELEYECPGYWFSNDPLEDPDVWNN